MNKGDCFVLDCGKVIYVYMGSSCKRIESLKAIQAANQVRDQDHAGKAKIIILGQSADETYQKLQFKLFATNQLLLGFWDDVFCSVSVWSLLILDSVFILSWNRSAKKPNYNKFRRNPRITYFQPSPCTCTKLHKSFLITTWNSIKNY